MRESTNLQYILFSPSYRALPDGPIRSTGEYNIVLIFHSDVKAKIKLNVKSEETADDVTTDDMEKGEE